MDKNHFKLIKNFISIAFLMYFTACQNSKSGEEEMKEHELQVLRQENNTLKERIKEYELRHPSTSVKHVFVVLNVTQEEFNTNGYSHHQYVVTTGIESYNYIDETLKYKILDQAQQSYLQNFKRQVDKGTVNKRELLVFDSYEEASKEREKYTIKPIN
jgi:hypothetical protein